MRTPAYIPRITIDDIERDTIFEACSLERSRVATALAEECRTTDDYAGVIDRMQQFVHLERCLDIGDELVIESRRTCEPLRRFIDYHGECIADDLRELDHIIAGDEDRRFEGETLEQAEARTRASIDRTSAEVATARAIVMKSARCFLRLDPPERRFVELMLAWRTLAADESPADATLHRRLLDARASGVLRIDADIVAEAAEQLAIWSAEAEHPETHPDDAASASAHVEACELIIQLAGRRP